ncbi:MAG: helix-turn-helix domain-containing protein [Kaiparowitsia implicata GSE-PSE-MK54-09C]|nr:helix-turn-helix domain-containing protein [Kaiparowitsia implicata GSE-PSE-MK54-09C]
MQVLWWLKTGQATSVEQLAEISGYHRTTVSRWLSQYRLVRAD